MKGNFAQGRCAGTGKTAHKKASQQTNWLVFFSKYEKRFTFAGASCIIITKKGVYTTISEIGG